MVSTTERAAVGLATGLVAIGLYQGAQVTTDHLASTEFPDHARFHAALGGIYMIGLSLVAGVVAWSRTLRRACRGLLLPAVLLLLPAGFLFAIGIVPEGTPPGPYVPLAIGGALGALVAGALSALAKEDE